MIPAPPRFPTGTGLLTENPFLEMLVRAPRNPFAGNPDLFLVRALRTRAGRIRLLAALVVGYAIQFYLIANWWGRVGPEGGIGPKIEVVSQSVPLIFAFFLYAASWSVFAAVIIILPVRAAGAMLTERGKNTLPLAAITLLRPRQFLVGLLVARTLLYWVAILAVIPALISNPLTNIFRVRPTEHLAVIHVLGSLLQAASWLALMVLGTMVAFLVGIRFRSMAVALPVSFLLLFVLSLARDLGEFLIPGMGGFYLSLIAYLLPIAIVVCSLWRWTEQQFDERPEHYVA